MMTINKHGPQAGAPEIWEELYESVNELMAHIGAFGEVDTQGPMCDRVMNALFDIDGGDYRPKQPNA